MRCGRFLKIIHFLLVASFFPRGKWGSANSKPIHCSCYTKSKTPKKTWSLAKGAAKKETTPNTNPKQILPVKPINKKKRENGTHPSLLKVLVCRGRRVVHKAGIVSIGYSARSKN